MFKNDKNKIMFVIGFNFLLLAKTLYDIINSDTTILQMIITLVIMLVSLNYIGTVARKK